MKIPPNLHGTLFGCPVYGKRGEAGAIPLWLLCSLCFSFGAICVTTMRGIL